VIEWSTTRSTGTSGSMAFRSLAQLDRHAAHGGQVGQRQLALSVKSAARRDHDKWRFLRCALGRKAPVGKLLDMLGRDSQPSAISAAPDSSTMR
jgi:hypothetical protein